MKRTDRSARIPGKSKARGQTAAVGLSPAATGREVAVAAMVEAATRLFATAGPDGVSLRAIAAEAGVNYGLIHQYVGSKDDLLRLVFRSVSERAAEDFADAADLDVAVARMFGDEPSPYVSMLAWALLQDRDASSLLGRSPALDALARRAGEWDREERVVRIAAVTAMSLGWRLFGRFVAAGVGGRDPSLLTQELRALARQLLESSESGTSRVTGFSMSPSGKRKRQ